MAKMPIVSAGTPASAGVVVSVTSANRCFPTGQGTVSVEADVLPWDNATFIRGLLEIGVRYGIAHHGTATPEAWLKLVLKTGSPDSKILKKAEGFLQTMEEADLSWEAVEAKIAKENPWTLASRDLDGLIDHFCRKAEADAKASDPLSAL